MAGIPCASGREVNIFKKSHTSGSSTDSIYTPKLWCYELLFFLNESSKVVSEGESNLRETLSQVQLEETEEIIFEGEIADLNVSVMSPQLAPLNSPVSPLHASGPSSSQSTYSMTTARRKRKKDNRDGIKELITSATSTLHNLTSSEPSVNLLFGQMLACEMDKILYESIVDDLKQDILGSLYAAKRKYRESQ
ncbi:hypothetical protein NQ314_009711 [Rhamnusium bicolor]|uniref:Uncharacterized protein n=1 Tax=Rhamnusium bicolor TaxID=1586634 RepID=A0AAV8XWT9_9CUCU|nr:hypothetical protein NQ314_009711 [Rhamnusium bicolor]